jgi:hypothetical protein
VNSKSRGYFKLEKRCYCGIVHRLIPIIGTGCAYHPIKLISKKPPRDLVCAAAYKVYLRRIDAHHRFAYSKPAAMAVCKSTALHFCWLSLAVPGMLLESLCFARTGQPLLVASNDDSVGNINVDGLA